MKNIKYIIILIAILTKIGFSQDHDHHNHNHDHEKKDSVMVKDSVITTDTIKTHEHHDMNNMEKDTMMMDHKMDMNMPHSYSLSLPMNRNGSGTGWLPDSSPMTGYMVHSGDWMLMFHGGVFLRYVSTDITKDGTRGSSKWGAPNWFMGMAQRQIGHDGLLHFNLMMSLDRWTEGGDGYPLLFQSGETWQGKRLVDRQHPHDLFSELSIAYTQRLSKKVDITGYFGYPGEPAIGPVAFMHRPSAMDNPDAPLGHHWQDATHIIFGVGTLGVRFGNFKIESSVFNGSEPDENRSNFDKIKFNSYSYRFSFNPNKNMAMQFSQGFIDSPEALEPGVKVTRTTASLIHSYNFTSTRNINTSVIWGMNTKLGHSEHSILLESNYMLNKLNIYGRYEFIQKDPEELDLEGFDHDAQFNISALTLGTNFRILQSKDINASLGVQGSIYFTPKELQGLYGKNPISAQIYLKISPPVMSHQSNMKKHH